MARLYKPPNKAVRYAGTLDLKCLMLPVPEATKKLITVVDHKTGTKPKSKYGWTEQPWQTAAYRKADGEAEANGMLHLDKETGLPTWFPQSEIYEQSVGAFQHLLGLWHTMHPNPKDGGVPSVTTVTGQYEKPALKWWSAGAACEFIADNLPVKSNEEGAEWIEPEDMYPIIEKARKEFINVGRRAMTIGSQVHGAIDLYLREGIEPPKTAPDEVTTAFLAFLEWFDAHKVEVIATEQVVFGQ